eukprot:TRINITY_DN5684_c0_g1_i1.p1 TRINITY_DN5684_c0_g1~~TRINITY_DN5684_c0_g1_i1.p1  ORF type:complete len:483 (+),score=178.14 TRINITY_DN5684_c0_g1_i1:74-1450(+)
MITLDSFVNFLIVIFGMGFFATQSFERLFVGTTNENQKNWLRFKYLLIFCFAAASDWLQGPYIYALYETYGLPKSDIAVLFLSGFLSSLVFGTFFCSLADKYGRKRMCLVYSFCYFCACLTISSKTFDTLLFGRVLTGISTALLHVVFESWLVHEHAKQMQNFEGLSKTLVWASSCNTIIAVIAGMIARRLATDYGFSSPFTASSWCLVICFILTAILWNENYGDNSPKSAYSIVTTIAELRKDNRILLIGLVQSLFEAAWNSFIFMWTTALQEAAQKRSDSFEDNSITNTNNLPQEEIAYGTIFVLLMASIAFGSGLFGLMSIMRCRLESIMRFTIFLAAFSLLFTYLFANSIWALVICFSLFKISCGLFSPCLSILRTKYFPEQIRCTLIALFRLPSYLFVIAILIKMASLSTGAIFLICSGWLFCALIIQYQLVLSPKGTIASGPLTFHPIRNDE